MTEQLLQYFFEKSPVAFAYHKVLMDDSDFPYDYEFIDVNSAYEDITGLKASKVIGKRYRELFSVNDSIVNKWNEGYQDAIINNKTVAIDIHIQRNLKWVRVTIFTLDKYHFVCMLTDVTKEYMHENVIDGLFKVNTDMLCVANTEGKFIKVNKEFENVLGYKVDELEGKSFLSLIHEEDIPATLEAIKTLEEQNPIEGFVNRYRSKNGFYRHLEWYAQPNDKYIYASAKDITGKKGEEVKTNQLPGIDELTGLLNRYFFDKRVVEEMERSDRYDEPLSILILDLDSFKNLNATGDYTISDEVVKYTAAIVSSAIRKYDILVRLDDEKFGMLMPRTNINGAIVVAEKIRKVFDSNIHPVFGKITASFGVAERMKSESFKSWSKRLGEALYHAKEKGLNGVVSADEKCNIDIASLNHEWKYEWESGNNDIDAQHKEILELANVMISMSLSGIEFQKIMNQLNLLLEHIMKHFDYEEQILIDVGYEDYDKHFKIHKNLVGKAFQFKEAYINGELNSSAFFSFIIDEVVIGHILDDDVDFFQYIKDKSIS